MREIESEQKTQHTIATQLCATLSYTLQQSSGLAQSTHFTPVPAVGKTCNRTERGAATRKLQLLINRSRKPTPLAVSPARSTHKTTHPTGTEKRAAGLWRGVPRITRNNFLQFPAGDTGKQESVVVRVLVHSRGERECEMDTQCGWKNNQHHHHHRHHIA